MKIVMTYPRFREGSDEWYQSIASAKPEGMEISLVAFDAFWTWPELDALWKRRDSKLFESYRLLLEEAENADVLFAWSSGVHPEILPYLRTFNCYFFTDDPEDSPWQSAQVAPSFEAAFHANIASGFQYESWGCKRHSWLPIFTAPMDVPGATEVDDVLNFNRTESAVFVGGFDDYSSYRRLRLERLSAAFPLGTFRGRGWPAGEIEGSLRNIYLQTRIGFNLHRTTGPINRRMFQLPAHGVMQICDNKTGLGQIFELGKEVEGFDTIDEAIELTKYYLNHEQERVAIARAGYERFWKDYHAGAVWTKLRDKLLEWGVKPGERKRGVKQKLPSRNVAYFFVAGRQKIQTEARRVIRATKAAKREYFRKDPWWKIYERVFTSEAVYLPNLSQYKNILEIIGKNACEISKNPKNQSLTSKQKAVRWALSQLVGKVIHIGVFDPSPEYLVELLKVDSKRKIKIFTDFNSIENDRIDLLLCVDFDKSEKDFLALLNLCQQKSLNAIFTFPGDLFAATEKKDESCQPWFVGECFGLLKSFFQQVQLFKMPDSLVPWLEPLNNSNLNGYLVARGLFVN